MEKKKTPKNPSTGWFLREVQEDDTHLTVLQVVSIWEKKEWCVGSVKLKSTLMFTNTHGISNANLTSTNTAN